MLLETHVNAGIKIWYLNELYYTILILCLVIITLLLFYHNKMVKKNNNIILTQQQHATKIDNIRKDCEEKRENLRIEMLKREEDRTRQWIESEKETLHVLSGVSNLLDLSEKINRVESDKILDILEVIRNKVEKITDTKN